MILEREEIDVNPADIPGWTPFSAASRDGNIRVVKLNKPTPQEERQY
jgi:hypothetical protein